MSKLEYAAEKASELSIEKLKESLFLLKKELFNLRFQLTLGELNNTSRFKVIKKDVARINTELSRRKNAGV
jgi:large subunit ribosomal protein L29